MLFGLLIQHVPLFPETYLMGHEKVFVVAAEDFRGWHTGSGRDGRDRCIAIFGDYDLGHGQEHKQRVGYKHNFCIQSVDSFFIVQFVESFFSSQSL